MGAGLLLGLDAEQMEHALGLAASGACGLSSHHLEPLHQIKSLNHGRAAEAGVLSALLAQEGCYGPKEVLTIEHGFFDAFLGLPSAGHEVVHGLGEQYLMRQIAYKRYPVGGPDQTPLFAFLHLIKTHELAAEDIEQIEVSVSRGAFHTVMTNQHPSVHLPTILSLAAVYSEITFRHIHDPSYREDPRVQAFRDRATRSGEVLRQELRYPLMTAAEIEQKFRDLVGLRLESRRVADLEGKLKAIESVENVAPLIRELELEY